jgi:predicted TIM-barrel fold metal-dependent hydrolase
LNLSSIEEDLLEALKEIEVVDAHEHLPPEKVRLEHKVDVFTLFSVYTIGDLTASGMPQEHMKKIHEPSISIEKRWELFSPYLEHIRYGSYARPAFIAAKEFYGFDDINEKNYKLLSEKIKESNKPGIYHRVLREKCNIRVALTQFDTTDYDLDLLVPLMWLDNYAAVKSKNAIESNATNLGEEVKSLDDYVKIIRKGLEKWKSEGVVGIKMVSKTFKSPSKSQAKSTFEKMMRNEKYNLPETQKIIQLDSPCFPELNPLYIYLIEEMLDIAADLGLVVAVHTGMWGDFRILDPQHMIPIIARHPKTKFDIYHMGIPYVRQTAIIGKNFPNVWLNLCWCHIISPKIAYQAMDELIDLVPINKIIAFGGDYVLPVEKVYGHLLMARENIVKVLGKRIKEKLLTENEAIDIAKKWFYNNPKELYKLDI